jgi:hypothetical protein
MAVHYLLSISEGMQVTMDTYSTSLRGVSQAPILAFQRDAFCKELYKRGDFGEIFAKKPEKTAGRGGVFLTGSARQLHLRQTPNHFGATVISRTLT